MSRKQDSFYFDNFIACGEASVQAAYLLRETLVNFKPENLHEKLTQIHKIEHEADDKKHHIMDRLVKEFIPPIEREDIVTLSQNIDELTDKIEEVLIRIYINNVRDILPEAIEMLDVIIKCCEEVCELLKDFADFKHSKTLRERIVRINALEEEADDLYVNNMRKLHKERRDPLHIIAWREIFDYLEKCADTCEHVADIVESVVMKNS